MCQKTVELEKSEALRKQAEKALKGQTPDLQKLSTKDVRHLVHELQVHQIELEMQNEELRRAQSELEDSRNRYSNLYDFAPIGYFTFDKNGLILEVNLTGANILGKERSFLIKKPFSLYTGFSSRDVFYLHLREVFRTNTRQTCEIKLVDKNNNQFDVQLESLAVKDNEGKFSQCRTAIIDITDEKKAQEALRRAHEELEIRVEERTAELAHANEELKTEIAERKRAAEALRESEGRLQSILDNSSTVVFLKDLEGRYITVNRRYEELFHVTRQDVVGKSDYDIFPREHADRFRQHDLLALEKGGPVEIEEFVPHDDGLHVYISVKFPLFTAEEKPYAVCGIATDITERKRAEEALAKAHDESELHVQERTADLKEANIELEIEITERRRAEEQVKEQAKLLDKAHDAIAVRDLEQRIIYWNNGAESLYGWTAGEIIGKNADELLYKGRPPKLIEAENSAIEKGEWMGELEQITKEGKEIIVQGRWTLVRDSEDKPKSILIINTDITEMKKLEAQLLRAQRMESIGTLAGGIAHDLNNMLTPIMLSLELLKEKFKDEQSQKMLTILERNSQRGADLLKQVLSFARGVEGECNPLQAKHIILEIQQITKETFPRNVEIRTEIPKDLFSIYGDATQLHQVIMNLCVNARDAMPDGGKLTIFAENFFIDENYARMHSEATIGPYIVISVSDTGIGIPPKILDRIFEPFFTTKKFGKGTGLGLSTVLAIVKSHGGFVDVYSKVGIGTTFRVYLPAIETEMQNIEEQQLELLNGQGELVLVAEDEDSVREVTVLTLEKYGYNVLAANDGVDAVALYAQNKDKIKVILMDMMMPVMDGHASIRAIRKINTVVKIIAVSGLVEKDQLAEIADTRVNAFLPKPYTAERLLKTMHEVLKAK